MPSTALFIRILLIALISPVSGYAIAQISPNTKEIKALGIAAHQLRTRTGDTGLSRLDENIFDISTTLSAWQESGIRLGITPTTLNAGRPALDARFGTTPTSGTRAIPEQEAQGTALQLAVMPIRNLHLQLGTTPLGFAIDDITGAIFWRHNSGIQQFRIGAEHRAVTDSVLSYAGTHDPTTGLLWGGVRQSRLRLAWSAGFTGWGLYAGGGVSRFNGHHVASNRNWEGSFGSYHLPISHPAATVVVATNLTAFGYDHNQSLFTLGQGGYFSPQTFRRMSVSTSMEGRHKSFSYFVQADIGWQKVREDNALWFPLDSSLGNQTSGSSASRQWGSSGRMSAEYSFSRNSSLGLSATLNRVSTFTEHTLQIYLRHWLNDANHPAFTPPRPEIGRDLFNEP